MCPAVMLLAILEQCHFYLVALLNVLVERVVGANEGATYGVPYARLAVACQHDSLARLHKAIVEDVLSGLAVYQLGVESDGNNWPACCGLNVIICYQLTVLKNTALMAACSSPTATLS